MSHVDITAGRLSKHEIDALHDLVMQRSAQSAQAFGPSAIMSEIKYALYQTDQGEPEAALCSSV
jgi:hypothetical protein